MRYARIADRLIGRPLLLEPGKLRAIVNALAPRFGLPQDETLAGREAAPIVEVQKAQTVERPVLSSNEPVIAVIDIRGSLAHRSSGFDDWSGLRSYQGIERDLESALADPTVIGILLDIDSGGGEVAGCFDLADRIRAARERKPLWAIANEHAFSAAYALACSASRVVLPRTAGVGSIGVVCVHIDQTGFDEKIGARWTAIHAGARKIDWWPHAELQDEAREAMQSEVDRIYGLFVETVAQNRGIEAAAVRATEAGLLWGPEAVAAGLADEVLTYQETISALAAEASRASGGKAASTTGKKETSMPIETVPAGPRSAAEDDKTDKGTGSTMPPGDEDEDEEEEEEKKATSSGAGRKGELDAARAAGRAEALAIVELCALGGGSLQMAASLIRKGASEADARAELMQARASRTAAEPEIAGQHQAKGGAGRLAANMKKLVGKGA